MSFVSLSLSRPKARKTYDCIWCTEHIAPGEVHIHEVSTYDGEFQDFRWHRDCYYAAITFFKINDEPEFEAHACKRGTCEAA